MAKAVVVIPAMCFVLDFKHLLLSKWVSSHLIFLKKDSGRVAKGFKNILTVYSLFRYLLINILSDFYFFKSADQSSFTLK